MALESDDFDLVGALRDIAAELSSMGSSPVWLMSPSIARTLSTRASTSQSVPNNSLLDKFEGLLIQCTVLHEEGQYDDAAEVIHQCRTIFKQHHHIISRKKSSCIQFCQCYAAHKLHAQHNLPVTAKYLAKSLQYVEDHDNDDYEVAVVQDVIALLNHCGLYKSLCRFAYQHLSSLQSVQDSVSWTSFFDACWILDEMHGMPLILREIKYGDRKMRAVALVSQIKYDICRAKYRSEYERISKVLHKKHNQLNNTEYDALVFYMDIKRGNIKQCMAKLDNGCIDVSQGNISVLVKAAKRWNEKRDFNALRLYEVIFRAHARVWKDNQTLLLLFAQFCLEFEHYILCKKILHLASKISKISSMKSILHDINSKIDNILSSLGCDYCGIILDKVKVCSGCGKVYFCGRKCQKQLWQKTHHSKCDKKWLDCIGYLKSIEVI
eukprot:1038302_1